jgi:hypothetical protein
MLWKLRVCLLGYRKKFAEIVRGFASITAGARRFSSLGNLLKVTSQYMLKSPHANHLRNLSAN